MKNTQRKKELLEKGTYRKFSKESWETFTRTGNADETQEHLKDVYGEDYQSLRQMMKAKAKQTKLIKNHIQWWIDNDYKIYFLTFTYDDKKRRKEMTPETLKKYVTRALQNVDDYIINIDYGGKKERLHYHGIIAMNENNTNKATKLYDYLKETGQDEQAEQLSTKSKKEKYIFPDDEAQKEYNKKVGFLDVEQYKMEDYQIDNKTGEVLTDDEVKQRFKTRMAKYITKLTLHSVKVKQKYVSTKKGTTYQEWKKMEEKAIHEIETLNKQHIQHGFNGKKIIK